MAIQKSHILENGLSCDNSYIRAQDIHLISKNKMSFILRFYVDNVNEKYFDEKYFTCSYDMNGDNQYAQAYRYIKSLDQYKDSLDV